MGSIPGQVFPSKNGLPIFLTDEDLAGLNGRYERLYNHLAPFYDFFLRAGYLLMGRGGERAARGGNLQFLPTGARCWGLDLSRGMLAVCRRRVARLGIQAELCLGAAEHLPYPDNFFDVVYRMVMCGGRLYCLTFCKPAKPEANTAPGTQSGRSAAPGT